MPEPLWVAVQERLRETTDRSTAEMVDLLKLDCISELTTIVSEVDLLEVRFPPEVEQNSEFTWFRALGGGFRISLGGAGYVNIRSNVLDKWEILAEVNGESLHGTRDTMEAAFKAADEAIRKRISAKQLAIIRRDATWQSKPLTKYPKMIGMLKRLFKGRQFPIEHMAAGQASKLINERLTKLNLSK